MAEPNLFLSRVLDYDDGRIKRDYFLMVEGKWGPHSVGRFANHENTQLSRFNSTFWYPGTEAIDAFSVSWAGESNWFILSGTQVAVVHKLVKANKYHY